MDAFFASVEQLDHPQWRALPLVVGADPKSGAGRGVVAACSYEARKFGIHSAMPISQAWKRCPDAIFVKPNMGRYAEVSAEVFEIFGRFTDLVEGISIDEAFLDVTGSIALLGDAVTIAREIKSTIRGETGLVASVGVASNKFVAKIASDLDKPDGLVVVEPDEVRAFLNPLPITRLWGVGEKSGAKLLSRGLRTIGDVAAISDIMARSILGDQGLKLVSLARGEDERAVLPHSAVKSIGNEETFSRDVNELEKIKATLLYLSDKVAARLRKKGFEAATMTLKFRNEDFKTITRSATLEAATDLTDDIYAMALELFSRTGWNGRVKIRLLGVTASKLVRKTDSQPTLFVDEARLKQVRTDETVDAIRARFGAGALKRGAVVGGSNKKGYTK